MRLILINISQRARILNLKAGTAEKVLNKIAVCLQLRIRLPPHFLKSFSIFGLGFGLSEGGRGYLSYRLYISLCACLLQ